MGKCVFCDESMTTFKPTVILTQKGCDGVKNTSEINGSCIRTEKDQKGLQKKLYPSGSDIKRPEEGFVHASWAKTPCVLRSESPKFDFKEHCLFFGRLVNYIEGTKRGYDVYPVGTKDFQKTVFEHSQNRKHVWADVVAGRLAYALDLHAADTIYHQSCNVNFRRGKQTPQQFCSMIVQNDWKKADLRNRSGVRPFWKPTLM